MIRLFLLAFSLFLSANVFSQTDSVFLDQNPEPILGKVLINYKKEKVTVKDGKNNPAFAFNDIRRIGSHDGGVYINQDIKSRSQLLLLLVEGKFSLLFHEKEKLFYVKKGDSLLVIPQAHFKRALPLIFGKELTDAYYSESNSAPDYTAKYLKRITSYANVKSHSPAVIHEQTIDQFKVKASIGLYAGFGYNRAAFDVSTPTPSGNAVYTKTGYASGSSVPLGLSLDIALAKRMSLRFDMYRNNVSMQNLNVSGFGEADIAFPNYIIYPHLYDRNLRLSEFSYKTFQVDIAGSYMLVRPERSKIRPYVFAGPTIIRQKSAEMGLSTGYRETKELPYRSMTGYVYIDRPVHMIGFNAGLGAQYDLNKRWTFRLAVKFIGGIYPKISHTRASSKTKNETTVPDKTWNFEHSSFSSTYDQYTRNVNIAAGMYFRL